jgi:hypothetical protein
MPRLVDARVCIFSVAIVVLITPRSSVRADEPFDEARKIIQRYCIECHNNNQAQAKVNFEQLIDRSDFAKDFRVWRQAGLMIEQDRMPPEDADRLPKKTKQRVQSSIRRELRQAAERHEFNPGDFVLRRLTSAEYKYSILDLTGLDLALEKTLAGDAVGGEGFANVGAVQFLQDSTLERYLEAAKLVADRAVIGSGPLRFFADPGQTGFELAAIDRIQHIYRTHGFRTGAGEGGEAFGLDKYPRAFFVAWQFQHRVALSRASVTLSDLASEEGIDVQFAQYMSRLLTSKTQMFPTSDIVGRWQELEKPVQAMDDDSKSRLLKRVRQRCHALHRVMLDWQTRFGQNADAKEEAPVLSVESFNVVASQPFEMNINWPKGTAKAHLRINIESANRDGKPNAIIVWKNPQIQWRVPDKVLKPFVPLKSTLDEPNKQRLSFGIHSAGGKIASSDFVTSGTAPLEFEIPVKPGATSARMQVTAVLDAKLGDDCIVRCTIAQEEETDQGKQISALLANPQGQAFELWRKGVVEFARVLPQVSQREPAPSDRDPIPPPFDNTYNNAERNLYHYKIKYYRDDQFLYDNILSDKTRVTLDQAWMDLLGSFEYHSAYLRFIARKYGVDTTGKPILDAEPSTFENLKPETRRLVRSIRTSKSKIDKAFKSAQARHLEDVIELAGRAWRKPLSQEESNSLRTFYQQIRSESKLNHAAATRALITRVLMAPDFLFRAERNRRVDNPANQQRADNLAGVQLTDWEIASRLSYFIWASVPDEALRQDALRGRLHDKAIIKQHALRMLKNPKAKRLADEFFGQWFGFYRFDQYKGIDPKRFREFDDQLKKSMHDEASAFFEFIVRNDRPINEILFADYTFLNKNLAAHYGVKRPESEFEATPPVSNQDARDGKTTPPVRVTGLVNQHRGGLFGLGAVLTVTSAPLRTSAVKRGDWVLRRVLGTPVPPPPADAGSIPADDVLADGLTVRKRLEAHRKDASCRNCHARIDPLGFALENYDPIGRWRDTYRDGQEIESSGRLYNGQNINGANGLRSYLKSNAGLFHRTLCTKLTGYAMGRRESISDALLIDRMISDVKPNGRFSDLVLRIVTSPQFLTRGKSPDK